MGQFIVEIDAVGAHGCQRNIKDGQLVQQFCGSVGCPDCQAREFVRLLKRSGTMVNSAKLTHWPGQTSTVQDDLITFVRKGNF